MENTHDNIDAETIATLQKEGLLDEYLAIINTPPEANKDPKTTPVPASTSATAPVTPSQKTGPAKKKRSPYEIQRDTAHLWAMAESEIQPMLYSKPSIYIEVEIGGKKIDCLVDTGAESNIITTKLVRELGLEHLLDSTAKSKVIGVGEGSTAGMIPYVKMSIGGVECPCTFTVMDIKAGTDMIMSESFMMFYRIDVLNSSRKFVIGGKTIPMKIKDH